ncbi:MAG: hypothetical protein OXI83_04485 [Gemmatimonadota bacterium]|nr:hypothetical protein [Gemmatimonadota bacterium]
MSADDQVQPESLGPPDAVLPDDFGYVHTAVELPGGHVLVADPLGKALYRVDMEDGTRAVIGSLGQGPGEYLQPDAVWPFRGDSILLVDLGNARLVRIGPDLVFGGSRPIATFAGDDAPVMVLPDAVDGEGNAFVSVLGGYPPPDSGAILRVGLTTATVDTVARYKLREYEITETDDGTYVIPIRLSPQDAWGVAPDGSVVIARAGHYGVNWFGPNGAVTRGDTVSYAPVPVTRADMAEDLRAAQRHGGVSIDSGLNEDGTRTTRFSRGGFGPPDEEVDFDDYTWHDVKPAFHNAVVRVDPLGRAWVRRHLPADSGTRYDVFSRGGQLVKALTLEGDRIVTGFGPSHVYIVAFNEVDLAHLERYELP